MKRKLKMGMISGGRDAFIGALHCMTAQLDGQIELVCGAFSSDSKKFINHWRFTLSNFQQNLSSFSKLGLRPGFSLPY